MSYLEIPDFHFDKKWLDVSLSCAESVANAAIVTKADFIAVIGDFWNRPVLASDSGGINTARAIIKKWAAICPVIAIEGTPSHDAPGSYEPLEDCGLKLIKIGDVFLDIPGYVIFGIPELNKDIAHAALNLSSEKANAETETMLAEYIAEFVAPTRLKYADRVAVGLLHGNVTDSRRENTQDIILRASDILIRTEILKVADIDRWGLGHIHIPWESKNISAGYAGFTGIDDNPYGKTGFKPAFNSINIKAPGIAPEITRLPYGTPERRKIEKALPEYDKNIAYWLDSDNPADQTPDGHAWSRVTHKPTEKVVKMTEINDDMKLTDIFRAWDKEVTNSVLAKVETVTESVKKQKIDPINVSVESVEINGSIFWKGGNIKFDIASQPIGVSRMAGRMGDGKSSLLGFCTPYPVIVGKDTESGRDSAIKEFFNGQDSKIEKIINKNGVNHRHLITIKAAHTKSAKTECYLYVDGSNVLETTSFDEMFTKCEELYGPYADYLLTTFYIQPLQSSQLPGLMAAKKVDARNVVQAIAGINRESESRYALDKKAECIKSIDDKNSFISGAAAFIGDSESLEISLNEAVQLKETLRAELSAITIDGKKSAAIVDELQKQNDENEKIKADLLRNNQAIAELKQKKSSLENIVNNIDNFKAMLLQVTENNKNEIENQKIKNDFDRLVNEYNAKLQKAQADIDQKNNATRSEYNNAVALHNEKVLQYNNDLIAYNTAMAEIEQKRRSLEFIIESSQNITAESCPKCGYIAPDIAEKLQEASKAAEVAKAELAAITYPQKPAAAAPVAPEIPYYLPDVKEISEPRPTCPALKPIIAVAYNESYLLDNIAQAEAAQKNIIEYNKEIGRLEAITFNVDGFISVKLGEAKNTYQQMRVKYSDKEKEILKADHDLESIAKKIEEIKQNKNKIEAIKKEIELLNYDLIDWTYIAKAFQPANIPALELEMTIAAIDYEATKILYPFHEGRYTVRSSAADGFDIMIYDSETATETSFFKKNPGHKAFFADAYTKALIRKRNEKQHRSYSPIIMDEADAPIEPESIQIYYKMQDEYFNGLNAKVLIVSHKGAGHIANQIDVKGLQGGN